MAPRPDLLEPLCWGLMLLVASAASTTDLRRGRIPNGLVVAALAVALAVHLAAAALAWLDGESAAAVVTGRLGPQALNAAVGLAAGLALYWAGLWSAGDAKLVFALALAQPAWVDLRGPLPWAPVLVVLANALAVALVFIAVEGLVRGVPRVARALRGGRLLPDPGSLRVAAASVARLGLAMAALAAALGPARTWLAGRAGGLVSGGPFLVFLLLFALYRPLRGVASRRGGLVGALLLLAAATGFALWTDGRAGLLGVGRSLLVAASVMATRGLLALSSRSFDSRAVGIEDLRPGAVLAPRYLAVLEADPRWREAFAPVLGDLRGVRVNQNYIDNIREWHVHNGGGAPVEIRAPLPFAPALAVAVLLTALVKGLVVRI